MDRRRVLIVIHQLNFGGVQKALLTALDAIDYDKNEVTLYVRRNDRMELLPMVNSNVSKIIINEDSTCYYRKPYAVLLYILIKIGKLMGKSSESLSGKLKEYVIRNQMEYEKKHYFSDGIKYDAAVSYIQRYPAQLVAEYIDANKKIMFFHGSTDEEHELHERIMPMFDAVVGVNSSIQHILEELYPMAVDKCISIENYVSPEEIRRKASMEECIKESGSELVICSCGRLTSVKGFDMAVDAAVILKENNIDFKWYFVGDGPERGNIEKAVKGNRLEDNIIITGMQENPYPWIKGCDVYVQPSYEEAHPLTIIEARILLKPIVSTKTIGGQFQIIHGENGLLADFSGKSIAEGIMKYINDSSLMDKVTDSLKKIDYTEKFKEYREQWEKLLGEN